MGEKLKLVLLISLGGIALICYTVYIGEKSEETPKAPPVVERTVEKEKVRTVGRVEKKARKRLPSDFKERQQRFKDYCLRELAIEDLRYESDWQIWVVLKPYKYTTKGNVKKIAEFIGRAYQNQTGFNDFVAVTVWEYPQGWNGGGIYAKGYVSP